MEAKGDKDLKLNWQTRTDEANSPTPPHHNDANGRDVVIGAMIVGTLLLQFYRLMHLTGYVHILLLSLVFETIYISFK